MASGGAPLTAAEVAPLFDASFAAHAHVALAVSGGSDSTALMYLAAEWRAARGKTGPSISVVTVDHGLRPGSAGEAVLVADLAHGLGLPHATLAWTGPKPETGVQAAAREARYRLIGAHLAANGWPAVATAHTEDDQAETLLLRLARGSGVDGLAAMRSVIQHDAMLVLRPLLPIPKRRLIATLLARGLSWSEDPSNQRLEFERVRLRAARAALEGVGLTPRPLAQSARRLARASDALDATTGAVVDAAGKELSISPLGFAEVGWPWLLRQPAEIRLRILSGLIAAVGGQGGPVSLGQLEALTEGGGWAPPIGRTLAGAMAAASDRDTVVLMREAGRDGLPALVLAPARDAIWDNRFKVRYAASREQPLTIRALGAAGVREVAAALPQAAAHAVGAVPRRALEALPGFWLGARLLAAPALGLECVDSGCAGASAMFIGAPFLGRRMPFRAV